MPAARPQERPIEPLPLPGALGRRRTAHLGRNQAEDDPVYYVGAENRVVAAVVGRLIAAAKEAPGIKNAATSIALIGPPGCGKSLLATGVAAAWADARGPEAVLCVTGLDLRRQLERSLAAERDRSGEVADLADHLAGRRLLVIEDLGGLAASPHAVELLTTTFDRLDDNGGRLLVTAGKPLAETGGLDTRLVGRLASGLTLDVAAPAEVVREELLVATLRSLGCQTDAAAASDLAAWLPADARRVTTVANQLHQRFGSRRSITRNDARLFLADAARDQASTPLTEIASIVARYYSMPLRQLRSSSRKAPIVLARAMAIYLARQLTPLSYDEIGRYLGGRDHTTVMHNYNRINKRLPKDRAMRSAMDDLFRKLGRPEMTSTKPSAEGVIG